MDAVEELGRGREAYAERAWLDAYEALSSADRATTLGAKDLELLATSAYMLGNDDDYVGALGRAHRAHLDAGEPARAVGCAFWIGHHLMFRGETGPAMGWFGRGQRLLEREAAPECVERGYMLIPAVLEHVFGGDFEAAYETATAAAAIGERFGDRDLVALAVMEQGHALVRREQREPGLRLVDETMVAVTAGELSPIVAGIVYCNTIGFCQSVFELRRAREWTTALTRWCEHQPDMVAHNGLCLVHRAELMTVEGAWQDALEELRRLDERFTRGVLNERALGHAAYRRGEIHRLRGELGPAEKAYREASRLGREPQPGLALLRLAQGDGGAAAASIRRAVGEQAQPLKRAALLPAYIEIMLAAQETEVARSACRQLQQVAASQGSDVLEAMCAHAEGAVALAADDAHAALPALRRAWTTWNALGAPYEGARARVLVALACRSLGDADAAELELDGARGAFEQLGATPDVVRVDALAGQPVSSGARARHAAGGGSGSDAPSADAHGLTARELEVLRLVAAGHSNREIAAELVVSPHTVARHVQNIFAKLGVSSRTAASAFAFEHDLV